MENINNENITYKVKPERDIDERIPVLHRNMLLPCDNLLDNFNWNIKAKPTQKKQSKNTASGLLPKKNDSEEERVTGNKDGSEMGEIIAFTPREIQIFTEENRDNIEKEETKGQKVEEKVDLSIELEKSRQELHREKVARPKGNEKMLVIDDGSKYCEIEGQKVDKKVDSPIVGKNSTKRNL